MATNVTIKQCYNTSFVLEIYSSFINLINSRHIESSGSICQMLSCMQFFLLIVPRGSIHCVFTHGEIIHLYITCHLRAP